ncbi:MAG: hypothetical protein D6770_03290 [Anaerolineae bacterium]|nr:MAG: hypothetical protein D6770_03290 [Anaerolineae bacterium]
MPFRSLALLLVLLVSLACGQSTPATTPQPQPTNWHTFEEGDVHVRLPGWPEAPSKDESILLNLSDGRASVWVKPWPFIPRLVFRSVREWAEKEDQATLLGQQVSPERVVFDLALSRLVTTLHLKTLLLYCNAKAYEISLAAPESDFETYAPLAEQIFAEAECTPTGLPPKRTRGALGMVILPAATNGTAFDPTAYQQALALARRSGVQVSHYYIQWGDVEKSPHQYDWATLDYILEAHALEGFQVSLVVNVIHTSVRGRVPADLEGLPFDDPRLASRLADFLAALAARYSGQIDYLAIGNEVNNYFVKHPDEVEAYASLFDQARQAVHAVNPDLPVGIVFAYHDAERQNAFDIIRQLQRGDYTAFTVYLYNEGFHFTRDPGLIAEALDGMLALAGDTPVAIVETGWNTAPELDGSEVSQAEYVRQVFAALRARRERLLFLSWFALHDSLRETCEEQALTFFEPGEQPDPANMEAFMTFICYFGLRRADGTPKAAWEVWVQEAENYLSAP